MDVWVLGISWDGEELVEVHTHESRAFLSRHQFIADNWDSDLCGMPFELVNTDLLKALDVFYDAFPEFSCLIERVKVQGLPEEAPAPALAGVPGMESVVMSPEELDLLLFCLRNIPYNNIVDRVKGYGQEGYGHPLEFAEKMIDTLSKKLS